MEVRFLDEMTTKRGYFFHISRSNISIMIISNLIYFVAHSCNAKLAHCKRLIIYSPSDPDRLAFKVLAILYSGHCQLRIYVLASTVSGCPICRAHAHFYTQLSRAYTEWTLDSECFAAVTVSFRYFRL